MTILKNSIKLCSLFALGALIFTSCSNDDDTGSTGNPSLTSSTRLYTSNNTDGNITYYDLTDMSNITTTSLITTSIAADGVYYDGNTDTAIQASRSGLALEGFTNATTQVTESNVNIDVTGTADMTSPREVAVNGDFYVVADNSDVDGDTTTPDGRLFIYKRSGIVFNGADLYAVVDATSELAVFNGFLSNSADDTVLPSKRAVVEGI
ncbi:hypothetical protein [Lacinutrix algicola]|uniref:hypothetical protein n=1 Tax=Lacinutrix algicola TaxID=342954 RepID=UPI000AC46682|nr:hypothetical protein [Lacinutrix algicola]